MNIACIGIGGTGNNLSCLARIKYGIKALNINTYRGDIKDLSSPSIILGESYGVAQDREKAKGMLTNKELEKILNKSVDLFKEEDIIFIFGSSAGGTGSGIIPTVSKALNEGDTSKLYIPIVGVPGIKDTPIELRNSGATLKELWNGRSKSFMLWKNEGNHHKVNEELLSSLFNLFSPRNPKSKDIDPAEIKSLFSTPGMASIKTLDTKSTLKNNLFLDGDQVKRVGIWADNIELSEVNKYNNAQVFKGEFESDLPKGTTYFETGHTLPLDYLKNISEVIKSKETIRIDEETSKDKEVTEVLKGLEF